MRIDEILDYNERFLQKTQLPIIGHAPRKNLAVVTCMDCRLVQMFEQALGLPPVQQSLRKSGKMQRTISSALLLAVSTCLAYAKSLSSVTQNVAWHM